jgi:hypothetical protein
LRDIFEEHGFAVAAAGESRFQLQTKRDMGLVTERGFAQPGIWRSTLCIFDRRVWRAFAANAGVDLYPSNLIQDR